MQTSLSNPQLSILHPRVSISKTAIITLFCLLSLAAVSRDPVPARHGVVVSASPRASRVGVEILQKGGNAVDAAVATGFALAVTHPAAGNIGGGGFMVIHLARTGEDITIDYREKAPAGASRDMYLDSSGNVIPKLSTVGHKAAAVPGSVQGMYNVWKKYGKLKWKDLVQPAIALARNGFPVSAALAHSLREKDVAPKLGRFHESKRVFLNNGNFFNEGDLLVQQDLAATLRRIAEQGPTGFYEGPVAEAIVKEMQQGGGLITLQDLKNYRAVFRPPVSGIYRGYEVVSMGPPSSGGVALVEMLNMIERFAVSQFSFGSPQELHLKAEVMRRAFADRAEFLGDADFAKVPVKGLTSKDYAAFITSNISFDHATPSKTIGHGNPSRYESPDTTHYSVVDKEGDAVATTTTLNDSYGSGVTVAGAGFLLNNEMDDFSSKPGVPNTYQLIQGEANAIGPHKRPLSAMTPTIVKKGNEVYMVTGSPGGPMIINTVFQILLNVIDHGMNIQESVNAPRLHHQWLPDVLTLEQKRFPTNVEHALQEKGHELKFRDKIGDAHSILIDPSTHLRYGAADPRRSDGLAVGY
ncbi:MAG TPA: gamma-glutamyltransferase [Acidobacteriota bacterium]|jgi:gamma-glutamyltranspeptidase/glutathione hydrolase|nr:gamma-glutamyltransferase [Acidobacteriota bacterium]